MSEQSPFDERVDALTERICENFWLSYNNNIQYFPDTNEGNLAALYGVEDAIYCIVASYLTAYPVDKRHLAIHYICHNIRGLEESIKNIPPRIDL